MDKEILQKSYETDVMQDKGEPVEEVSGEAREDKETSPKMRSIEGPLEIRKKVVPLRDDEEIQPAKFGGKIKNARENSQKVPSNFANSFHEDFGMAVKNNEMKVEGDQQTDVGPELPMSKTNDVATVQEEKSNVLLTLNDEPGVVVDSFSLTSSFRHTGFSISDESGVSFGEHPADYISSNTNNMASTPQDGGSRFQALNDETNGVVGSLGVAFPTYMYKRDMNGSGLSSNVPQGTERKRFRRRTVTDYEKKIRKLNWARQHPRISVGKEYERWERAKEEAMARSHAEFATLLLDCWYAHRPNLAEGEVSTTNPDVATCTSVHREADTNTFSGSTAEFAAADLLPPPDDSDDEGNGYSSDVHPGMEPLSTD